MAYGSLLAPVLMKRIPQEIALIVSREVIEDSWNLDDLLKIVEREIQAKERTTRNANGTARRPNREPTTASVLLTDNSVSALCCFCNKPHTFQASRTVSTMEAVLMSFSEMLCTLEERAHRKKVPFNTTLSQLKWTTPC